MKIGKLAKGLGFAFILVSATVTFSPVFATVFEFNTGLAFKKEAGLDPRCCDFSVLHKAELASSMSGTVTHRLIPNVAPASLPQDVRDDLLLAFSDNLGGTLQYQIDNGAAGSADITAAGALHNATLTFGANAFQFDGTGSRTNGALSLNGSVTLQNSAAFAGDTVATPFGSAQPQYIILGTIGFTFQYDGGGPLLTGVMDLMTGTMGPFNGLAVGAGPRTNDVTLYLWAASRDAISCTGVCDYNGSHFAMDMALWGTSVSEPESLPLLGMGLAGIVLARRGLKKTA